MLLGKGALIVEGGFKVEGAVHPLVGSNTHRLVTLILFSKQQVALFVIHGAFVPYLGGGVLATSQLPCAIVNLILQVLVSLYVEGNQGAEREALAPVEEAQVLCQLQVGVQLCVVLF